MQYGWKKDTYKNSLLKPYKVHSTYLLLNGAICKFCNDYNKNEITILDLGGSCGAVYFEMRGIIGNNIKFNWNVVDLPEMKKSAIKNNMENDELHFYDNLKDVQDNIDLVHTSSTLHYIDNCYDKIFELMNLNAKYIVFNRMLFNDSEKDRFMIQHSAYNGIGPGEIPQGFTDKKIDFPIIIMSFGKFNKLLETKYELEWIFNNNKRGHEGISLLYVKK